MDRAPITRGKPGVGPATRRLLSWGLMVTATAYLTWMLKDQGAAIAASARRFDLALVLAATACLIPMFMLKALYHARLLRQFGRADSSLAYLTETYLQAQLVRYLPGKIWGIVYQSRRVDGSHAPGAVVVANLWQMLLTNLLAVSVLAGILGISHLGPSSLVTIIVGLALVELIHRHPQTRDAPIKWLARRAPRFGIPALLTLSKPDRWKSTALLASEWVFYFPAFVLLHDGLLSAAQAILLGAWYSAASILSLAAFVVPAGLAVREAIFVSGASTLAGAHPALLIVSATMLRLLMIAAEIVAALLATVFNKVRRHGC
ncbi:hypothetical protein CO641_00500 [Lysobacteraceae bacterium NML91-0213]|nr:hypothetical protein CO641_00500 [Xanthomonadaceae bacterium NML91-0213]